MGIAAFYPAEKPPEYPVLAKLAPVDWGAKQDETQSAQVRRQAEEFQRKNIEFRERSKVYNRNVSIIALSAAVLIVVASLVFVRQFMLISDGLLLGGLVALVYSIGRGFGQDNIFRFAVVTVGLILSLVVGYVKFSSKK